MQLSMCRTLRQVVLSAFAVAVVGVGLAPHGAAAAAAPTDTPIEPITQSDVELVLAMPEADALCVNIYDLHSGLDDLGRLAPGVDMGYLHDWVDAWFSDSLENALQGSLTVEAQAVFDGFVDACRLS